MASSSLIVSLSLLVSLFLVLPSVHGNGAGVICEELPQDLCAFSISSSGRRCVLESSMSKGSIRYQCGTSGVVVTNYMADWIETDECVSSCGLDRNTVGISSDSLLERNFREKLCSTACYQGCPNIVDLYSNLSSGEGVSLTAMCKAVQGSRERILFESFSGAKAFAPAPAPGRAPAPAPGKAPAPTPGRAPAPTPGRAPAPAPGKAPAPTPGRAPAPTPGRAPAPAPRHY